MIATLRRRLIAVSGRLVRHARHLILRLPPGHSLLPEVLARLRDLPAPPDLRLLSPGSPSLPTARQLRPAESLRKPRTRRVSPGRQHARHQESRRSKIIYVGDSKLTELFAESGQKSPTMALAVLRDAPLHTGRPQ